MLSVTITEKDGPSTTTTFDKNEVLIGRVKGNDVVLPKTNVSKRHSRIVVKDGRIILVDLKSTNGTFVNGRKITAPCMMEEGDKVFIGDFTIEVQEIPSPGATQGSPHASMSSFGGVSPASLPSIGAVPQVDGRLGSVAGPGGGDAGASSFNRPSSFGLGPQPTIGNVPSLGAGPSSQGVTSLGMAGSPLPGQGVSPAPNLGAGPAGPGLGAGPAGSGLGAGSVGMGPGAIAPGLGGAPLGSPMAGAPSLGVSPSGPALGGMPHGVSGGMHSVSSPAGAAPSLAGAPAVAAPGLGVGHAGPGLGAGNVPQPASMGPGLGMVGSTQSQLGTRSPGVQGAGMEAASKPSGFAAPAGEGAIDKSQKGAASSKLTASQVSPQNQKAAPRAAGSAATLPEEIIVDDARSPESEARIKAARIVMDAYLSEVDFQSLLSQSYPPEPDVQDACYAQLLKCVNDHRAALGGVNPDALLDFLLKEACGLGAIDTLIDDEEVTDFTVYSFETIVAERNGRREISELQFTSADVLYLAAQRLLAIQGLNAQTAPAFTEGRLGDGTQIEIVLPPVSVSSTYIVVRKTCRRFNSLSALVHSETLSSEMAKFLLLCVKARRNILVVGPQGSGRTSILNALGSEIPDGERIVTVENSAMMLVPQLYVMSLEAQNASYGQGSELAALIRYASKLRAERVLVDTVQTPSDARAFLSAICAGAQGSMATMSGLTAGDGFQMLGYLAEADNALSKASSILGVIDIVIATRAFTDAKRRIVEISEVVVLEDGSQGLIPLFEWVDGGMGGAWAGAGHFRACGHVARFCQALERGGVSLDPSIFNA